MRKAMFKSVVIAVVLAAMVGLCFGCAPTTPNTTTTPMEENQPVTLKIATYATPGYGPLFAGARSFPWYLQKFGKDVNIKVDWYHSETVYKAKEIGPACEAGTLDIGIVMGPNYDRTYTTLGAMSLPFIWDSEFSGYKPCLRGYPVFDICDKELSDHGLKLLCINIAPPEDFLCTKPLLTPEDWKGVKVRVAGAIWEKMVGYWGGKAVPISSAEISTSLQTGLIDAAQGVHVTVVGRHLYDYAKCWTSLSAAWFAYPFFMNKAKYDNLSPRQRDVVDAAADFENGVWRVAWKQCEDQCASIMKAKGVTFYTATAEQRTTLKELAKPTYDWWETEVCPKYGAELISAIEESQKHEEFKEQVNYWFVLSE